MNGDLDGLRARIERLEATEQIRQLAARYALALDSRDVETLVSLFVPDVTTGDGRVGREALAEWFDPVLRPYKITFHLIGNHIIKFQDDDHATGVVYCTAEVEDPDHGWIRQSIVYQDRYERVDGQWYFRARDHQLVYGQKQGSNPLAQEPANWPHSQIGRGTYPPP